MTKLSKVEKQFLEVSKSYADAKKQVDEFAAQEKEFKQRLLTLFQEHDLKKFENEILTITRVAGSESTSIDLSKLEKKEPNLYADLLADYPKITTRSESLRIKVK